MQSRGHTTVQGRGGNSEVEVSSGTTLIKREKTDNDLLLFYDHLENGWFNI